jgi:hypothetical protein
MIATLKVIIKCEVLDLTKSFQKICFVCALSKACEYAINGWKCQQRLEICIYQICIRRFVKPSLYQHAISMTWTFLQLWSDFCHIVISLVMFMTTQLHDWGMGIDFKIMFDHITKCIIKHIKKLGNFYVKKFVSWCM